MKTLHFNGIQLITGEYYAIAGVLSEHLIRLGRQDQYIMNVLRWYFAEQISFHLEPYGDQYDLFEIKPRRQQ